MDAMSEKLLSSEKGSRELDVELIPIDVSTNVWTIRIYLSDTLSANGKVILISVGCAVLCCLLILAVILYRRGYFSVVQYYFKKQYLSLPEEISWSFLLHLKYPYKWTFSGPLNSGFYSYSFEKNSSEWNKVDAMFRVFHADSRMDFVQLQSITAVLNPSLLSAFIAKWKGIDTRVALNASLFKAEFREKEKNVATGEDNIIRWNSLREDVNAAFSERLKKCTWNKPHSAAIIPVVHATDYNKACFISMTGFASLSLIDAGYYGKGIYFSSCAFYCVPYLINCAEPALILSYVICGNIYPVIESPGVDRCSAHL